MEFSKILRRIFLFVVIVFVFGGILEASPRHAKKRALLARRSNKTFENNYKKPKRNFLESYEKASSTHPLCYYPSFMGIGPKRDYYMEFYKKRCNNVSLKEEEEKEKGPSSIPKTRAARNSRRISKKRNELSPKKKKKIDKLLKKSMCRTLKVMVPVKGPYEDEDFYPCMIPVSRCSGCCLSRLEECVPSKTRIRKFDVIRHCCVLRSSHLTNQSTFRAKIEEHIKCECRCKVKASDCGPGQIYEEKNCLCKCPAGSHTTCPQTKRWSERDCKCICIKERDCSTGMSFNHDTCLCERQQHYLEGFLYEEFS
ncbi:UNVERIFIED_CONTAM: hypothetical protein RMT77_012187 [Armadillidium vulgare]